MNIAVCPSSWAYGSGPLTQTLAVAEAATSLGHTITVLCAERHVSKVRSLGYAVEVLPTPSELLTYPRELVETLDDVVMAMGAADERFVRESISCELHAFRAHSVEAVFHDYQLSAPISSALAGIPCVSTSSWPDHSGFRSSDVGQSPSRQRPAADAFNEVIVPMGIPALDNVGELLFDLSTPVAPTYPCMDPQVGAVGAEYVGHLTMRSEELSPGGPKWQSAFDKRLLAYSSGGDFCSRDYLQLIRDSSVDSDVIVAGLDARQDSPSSDNIRCFDRVPLQRLLRGATVFLNHGGRNSVANGVRSGTPQLIYAGADPERLYFAQNVARSGLGLCLTNDQFTPREFLAALELVMSSCAADCEAARVDAQRYTGEIRVVRLLEEVAEKP